MAAEAKEGVDPDAGDLVYDTSDEPPVRRVALVTGANKGIGLQIVRQLAAGNADMLVYLTARNAERGRAALKELRKEGLGRVVFFRLDIEEPESVAVVAEHLETTWGRLDVLVHNAGFAYKGDTWGHEEARHTVDVNYRGAITVCDGLMKVLRRSAGDEGRIVTQAGRLRQLSRALQGQFTAEGLSREALDALMEKFVASVKAETTKAEGWSKSMYGISKLGEIAFTKILADELRESNMHVNACCPGWCATDMSSMSGTKTAAEGADTPVWLATRETPDGSRRGLFFYERSEIGW